MADLYKTQKLANTIKIAKRGRLSKSGRRASRPGKRKSGMNPATVMNMLGGGA